MDVLRLLRTLICYVLAGVGIILLIPPCFIIACLPARLRYDNRVFFFLLDCFYKYIMYASLNPVTIRGKENLPVEPAIFAANHESAFDIPVVGSLCNGYPHVWFVLAYYVNAPILGFFIKRMFVPVERDIPEKAAFSLRRLIRFVQAGKRHLIIFPEGARSNDRKIHEFYEGFAVVAKATGRPVIPVYMPTTGTIYPIYSFYVYSAPLDVIIGKPMIMTQDETEAQFVKRVRDWFVEQNKKYFA
jgi:1-acyl-sn-glycerol-3-phosphate acyltransferase